MHIERKRKFKRQSFVYKYLLVGVLLFAFSTVAKAQYKTIDGLVTDENSVPLPGVRVMIKGVKNGSQTDSKGVFKIQAKNTDQLVFSYVGFTTKQVSVGNKNVIDVILQTTTTNLDEIVVVGYGTRKKSDVTGSVSKLSVKDMLKAPVRSFDEALAGRISGVQVTSSDGQPGAGVNIVIRGNNSVTQGNSPLYVIDGFLIENPNNGIINPKDIESIDILKDASATAIYGARGANGVIVITTKKGKKGAPEFSFDTSDGYQETGRLGNTNGITITGSAYPEIGYSYGFIRGTARLYKAYKTGDKRRDWTLTTFTYNGSTGVKNPITSTTGYGRDCAKWRREFELTTSKHKNNTAINFPVLRYADVLLMLTESENQVNGPSSVAYEAVNQVRRRGFGLNIATPSVVADLPVGLSKDAFQLAVENERMLELCFEGTRHSDLIRWGKYVSTMNSIGAEIATGGGNQAYGGLGGKNVTDRNLLYPIPSRELSINKNLIQNVGW